MIDAISWEILEICVSTSIIDTTDCCRLRLTISLMGKVVAEAASKIPQFGSTHLPFQNGPSYSIHSKSYPHPRGSPACARPMPVRCNDQAPLV